MRSLNAIKRKKTKGFTLVELLVVIAIILIIAAVLFPQIAGYADRARVARATADVRTMKGIIDIYSVNEGAGKYPTTSNETNDPNSIASVMQRNGIKWTGREDGISDPWGKPYYYKNLSDEIKNKYIILSCGPDRTPGTDDDIYATDDENIKTGKITEDISNAVPSSASPDNGDETQPNDDDETQPGTGDETQPGDDDETQPGNGDETQPGDDDETQPGDDDETQPGTGGGAGPLRQPDADEIPIRTPEELAKIGNDPNYPLDGKYIQMADIDLSIYSSGAGWVPIGTRESYPVPFTGQFDGNGFVIKNLTINRPSSDYQGLFAKTGVGARLTNVALENINVTGHEYTGGLVGDNYGIITNSYSTGSVTGNEYTGGLVGYNGGAIANSYSTCSVTGYIDTGGLVGYNYYATIANSYFTGSVTGNGSYSSTTGGLVGYNYYGTIKNSYSTGSVTGSYDTGGLVGFNEYGVIRDSYSTGSVKGRSRTGGLVGRSSGYITNSYSTGSVTGDTDTGGLVGYKYAGTLENSYWDAQASGLTTPSDSTGKTTAEMKTKTTFVGWDFSTVWDIIEGQSYPFLRNNPQIPPPGM